MHDGIVAGIGAIIFHANVCWLAHIVVHPSYRNHGFGSRLTQHMINSIPEQKAATISLLATELGYTVYEKFGFKTQGIYHFYKNTKMHPQRRRPEAIVPIKKIHEEDIYRLDRVASGEDRSQRLKEFLKDGFVYNNSNGIAGFFLPSFGEGLIIAENSEAGFELMKYRNSWNDIAILPAENKKAVDHLEKENFRLFRTARRMWTGKKIHWNPEMIYNRVSGQIG